MNREFDPPEKMCDRHSKPIRRVGFVYFNCPDCEAEVSNPPTPSPIRQSPAEVVDNTLQTKVINSEPHVWLLRVLYDNLMRYYREGEQAKHIMRKLGHGKKGMTLLATIQEFEASIRDSSGIRPVPKE